jgi:hypothetical protein
VSVRDYDCRHTVFRKKRETFKNRENPFTRVQGKGTSAFREAKKLLAAVEKDNT